MASVKKLMGQSQRFDLDERIKENRAGFLLNQASFRESLDTYQNMAKDFAREVLHILFFEPRGHADIPKSLQSRIDFLHEMLGLENDETLCGEEHPVAKEYDKPSRHAAIRFFPKSGNDGKTIVDMSDGSQSALFVAALGKTQLILSTCTACH